MFISLTCICDSVLLDKRTEKHDSSRLKPGLTRTASTLKLHHFVFNSSLSHLPLPVKTGLNSSTWGCWFNGCSSFQHKDFYSRRAARRAEQELQFFCWNDLRWSTRRWPVCLKRYRKSRHVQSLSRVRTNKHLEEDLAQSPPDWGERWMISIREEQLLMELLWKKAKARKWQTGRVNIKKETGLNVTDIETERTRRAAKLMKAGGNRWWPELRATLGRGIRYTCPTWNQ